MMMGNKSISTLIITMSLFLSLLIFPVSVTARRSNRNNKNVNSIPSKIVKLNDGNFNEQILYGDSLVYFYAPWCSQCKQFKNTWHALGRELNNEHVLLGQVRFFFIYHHHLSVSVSVSVSLFTNSSQSQTSNI